MSGIKTLVRHSSHYITGQAFLMAMGFISFPIFTRVFSVADYGVMEIIGKIALLGTAAGKLGVQNAILRFYDPKEFESDPAAARRFYSTSLLGPTATSVLAAAVTAIIFFAVTPDSDAWKMALIAAALAVVRVLSSVFFNLFRAEHRAAFSNWTNVAQRALTLTGILSLFALFSPSLRLYFLVTVAVELLVVGIYIYLVVRRGLISFSAFDGPLFRSMVAFGLPMLAFETLTVALDSSDRMLIRRLAGDTAQGFYAAAYTVCIYIQDLLMIPINMAMVPIYLRIWNNDGRERTIEFLSDSFRMFVIAAACMVAGVTVCAEGTVHLLASEKYSTSATLIPWIVTGMVFYAANSFFNAPLLIEKRTVTMAKLVGTAVVFKTLLNFILLPAFGLIGAVISTMAGYAFLLAITARTGLRLLPVRINGALIAKCIACAAVAAYAGLQIHIPSSTLLELAARALAVLVIYFAALAAIDTTARGILARALELATQQLRTLTNPGATSPAAKTPANEMVGD